jgi:hypothetical protein
MIKLFNQSIGRPRLTKAKRLISGLAASAAVITLLALVVTSARAARQSFNNWHVHDGASGYTDASGLSNPANRTALKGILIQAATLLDSDGDGLPDQWEQKYLGGLASKPTDDPDGDGFDNRTEFAWGTDPADPKSKPRLAYGITGDGRFFVSYYRWGGGVFNYLMEASSDLKTWDGTSLSVLYGSPQNLYDGSGRSQMIFYPTQQVKSYPLSFLRLLVTP